MQKKKIKMHMLSNYNLDSRTLLKKPLDQPGVSSFDLESLCTIVIIYLYGTCINLWFLADIRYDNLTIKVVIAVRCCLFIVYVLISSLYLWHTIGDCIETLSL